MADPGRPELGSPHREVVDLGKGRSIAYAAAGSGPDLICLHGTLMTLDDMWLGPVPALSRHFRVSAIDRPGHGGSARLRHVDASPWRQAEIVRDAVRAIGLRRPVVLGHSFGGAVALAYGLLAPDEIAGVVALAPICFPEPRLEQMLFGPRAVPVFGDILSAASSLGGDRVLLPLLWNAMFLPQAMPPRFADEFPFDVAGRPAQVTADGEDAAALWPALTRSALGYAACRTPVHILCGDADTVVNTITQGAAASRIIPGAVFDRLPGIGHMLHHFAVDAVVAAAASLSGRRHAP